MTVKARVCSLEQDGKIYKVTVADVSRTGLDEIGILDLAVKTVTRNVAIKLDQRCGCACADAHVPDGWLAEGNLGFPRPFS